MNVTNLFHTILQMSYVGGITAAAVLLIRLCLRRAPKTYSYLLWGLVFFRLACPVSFESSFSLWSLFEQKGEPTVISDTVSAPESVSDDFIVNIDSPISHFEESPSKGLEQQSESKKPIEIWDVLAWIWAAGAAATGIWSIISYVRLKCRVQTATKVSGNIFETDRICTGFVCGIIRPRIYLPVGLTAEETACVLAHEKTHIRRLDYVVKPLAFAVLCLHWFNPMAWVAFAFMGRDMEMACDERALSLIANRSVYSRTLWRLAQDNSALFCPLAFGGGNMKQRIKHIVRYRKPSMWIAIICALLLVGTGVFLLANPKSTAEEDFSEYIGSQSQEIQQVQVRVGSGNASVDADQIKALLINADWKRIDDPMNASTADWIFEVQFDTGILQIELILDKANTAFVSMNNSRQAFEIPEADWQTLCGLAEEATGLSIKMPDSDAAEIRQSAESVAAAYITAMLESDYSTIASLTPSIAARGEEDLAFGMEIWNTIDISNVIVESEEIRETRACYELQVTVADPGNSAFEEGVTLRWLYLIRGENGWYVEGLMTSGSPDEDWWNAAEYRLEDIQQWIDTIEEKGNPIPMDQFQEQIKAHPEEYDKLISCGETALLYMAEEFEQGGQDGLRGRIMEAAYREILGGEDIKVATQNGQQWYDSYKAHIIRLYQLNGEEFMKERTDFPQFLDFLLLRAESVRTGIQTS